MKFSGSSKYLPVIIFLVFILSFIYALSAPISDPDLFWHLANGKWIIENRMLPDHDPFAYTTQAYAYEAYQRTFFILTSYWLSQILIYFSYVAGGYWGILALRILVFLGIIGTLFKWLKEKGYSLPETLIFLIPAAWALTMFIGERPNQLTYLFSIVALYFLYAIKDRAKKGWLLVPVMILWANSHGGFVLGMVLTAIFLLFEMIDAIAQRRQGKMDKGYPKAVLTYGIALVSCGLNPSGFKVFRTLMELTDLYSIYISESLSPVTLLGISGNYRPLLIAVLIALVLLAAFVTGLRKRAEGIFMSGVLFLFLIILSFKSVRYVPFLVILPLPAAASYLRLYFDRMRPLFIYMLVSIFLFLFIAYLPPLKHTVIKAPILNPIYPEGLVSYMKNNNITENMFNSYDIGGYLLWRLYPDTKVFIDGRGIIQKVLIAHIAVENGDMEDYYGQPKWKSILGSYKIKNIILSPLGAAGNIWDLVDRLYEDPEWRLIYIDNTSGTMLFRNDALLPELPKILAYSNVLNQALIYRMHRPENPIAHVTVARAHFMLGRRSDAIKALEAAITAYPAFRTQEPGKALEYLKDNRTWW